VGCCCCLYHVHGHGFCAIWLEPHTMYQCPMYHAPPVAYGPPVAIFHMPCTIDHVSCPVCHVYMYMCMCICVYVRVDGQTAWPWMWYTPCAMCTMCVLCTIFSHLQPVGCCSHLLQCDDGPPLVRLREVFGLPAPPPRPSTSEVMDTSQAWLGSGWATTKSTIPE